VIANLTRTTKRLYRESTERDYAPSLTGNRFRWTTKRLYRESTERITDNNFQAIVDWTTKRLYRESTERLPPEHLTTSTSNGPLNGSTERALKGLYSPGGTLARMGPLNGSTERALKEGSID